MCRLPNPDTCSGHPCGATRIVLWVVTLALGLYGLALLAVPAAASWFWPWRLDAFHAQLYSATFLTPAAGAWVLLRGTTSEDQRALGLTLAGWGLLPIVSLFLADAPVQRVQWAAQVPGCGYRWSPA